MHDIEGEQLGEKKKKNPKEFPVPILKNKLSAKLRCSSFLKTRCKVMLATVGLSQVVFSTLLDFWYHSPVGEANARNLNVSYLRETYCDALLIFS